MTNFQKLKHEARRAEQRSDWGRAIDLYQRALDADEDMADLSLYNRIGDLHLRLAQNEAAVECYERAVDRYADNGMHTSAIALCNKILRIAPGRISAYRRLGMLHARSGLVAEGRSNTLTFVDRLLEGGDPLEAATAVDEFVELTGDEEIRLRFADRLEERDNGAGAGEQLRIVYAQRRRRGSDAAEIRERLEGLTPDGVVDEMEAPESRLPDAPRVRLAALVADAVDAGAATFEAEPTDEAPTRAPARDPALQGLRRAFTAFREAVQNQLEDGDATIRYDLGVELMTIGLLDEAIEEFHAAVADPALMEAANARIGECLALRTSGAALDLRRGTRTGRPERRPASAAVDPDAPGPASAVPAGEDTAGDTPAASGEQPAVESADVTASDGEAREHEEHEEELQGHFFRARLAQYRIRQAEQRHMTDHAAHLDLGNAYVGMDLLQEALRELGVALGGPRPVSARAARAMAELAVHPDAPHEVALDILERLAAVDTGSTADKLAAQLAADWGEDHPGAGRLAELAGGLSDARELPALEEMFPVLVDGPAVSPSGDRGVETAASKDVESATGEPSEVLPAKHQADAPEADSAAAVLERAERLLAEQGEEPADSELRLGFARLRQDGRTRQAGLVLDRLVELRPDDPDLLEQRAELALMVNDRPGLVSAYLDLAACLLRLEETGRARVAFGRVLDIEPDNETAKSSIAGIDRAELERERAAGHALGDERASATEADVPPGPDPGPTPSADEAEVDALLDALEVDETGEAEPDAADSGAADAAARSHYELGLAFRQMGMWEEAARELQAALNGVEDRLAVLESLSECLVRAGHTARAIDLLGKTLRADEDGEQVVPLYWLGLAHQAEGDDTAAREVFGRIEAVEPGYRDTAERLSELSL